MNDIDILKAENKYLKELEWEKDKEIERLRTLVEEAYKEGYFYAAEDLSLDDAWSRSTVLQALKEK